MALIDREKDIEKINRDALRLAREVADKTGTLMCGNICNTNAYKPNDPENDERLKQMFKVSILFYYAVLCVLGVWVFVRYYHSPCVAS